MALNYRPIVPKTPQIRNKALRQFYGSENPHCEICLLRGDVIPRDHIHHLKPGSQRTDLVWNMLSICMRCHFDATEHINGEKAVKLNLMCFGIKYLKGEVDDRVLRKLKIFDEVMLAIEHLIPLWANYKKGML